MAKVALPKTRMETGERGERASDPQLTLYSDGLAKLTRAAHHALGDTEMVHVLHDSENKSVIYLSTSGGFEHKVGRQGTFSAASLHRHVGSPDRPMYIPLSVDADGDLVGDLSAASYGENRPRGPRATVDGSEGGSASTGSNTQAGSVDRAEVGASTENGPGANDPSDTSSHPSSESGDDDYDDEEDEEGDDEETEDVAPVIAPAATNTPKPVNRRK